MTGEFTMVKLIAFHLPQYHAIPENDSWWGEGFTDWDNVNKAKPMFEGHSQPRVPLDGCYNMLDRSTHLRQAELARRYGIYGFCYYHYWFSGKLLLEKPLELILREKDVDLPFCMCWANEPWTRSWDGQNREVIMPQDYDDKTDWEKHISYLMPFFKDDRYIKVDNKPMFVIYRTNNVTGCEEIIDYWDSVCRENGFAGIYIVEENNNFQHDAQCKNSSAILDFEPGYTRSFDKGTIEKAANKISLFFGKKYSTFSYEKTCEHITERPLKTSDKPSYLGIFTGWDNTPRRAEGGTVTADASPQLFEKFLARQIERSNSVNNEFLFINAWNEWAEGAYLEPDTANGYAYLEAVQRALTENN